MQTLREQVLAALKKFTNINGAPERRELLNRVAGVDAPSEIPDDKLNAVLKACGKTPKSDADGDFDFEGETPTLDPVRIWAKWNSAGKRS